MTKLREYTTKILDFVDDGTINREQLIQALLLWMSEYEVKEFYESEYADELEAPEEYDEDVGC